MGEAARVHAFVFCWPGKEAGAHRIAQGLAGHVDKLTVLYKNDTGAEEAGPGEWVRFPSDRFWGWQFSESLRRAEGDIVLQIQADVDGDDWPRLVARCRYAFATYPEAGIWTVDVDYTGYSPQAVRVCALEGEDLVTATMADAIVWALSRPMVERLRQLDYSRNNLGWGTMEAASALAVTSGHMILMDTTCRIRHPRGSGYDLAKALEQSGEFTRQLPGAAMSYLRSAQLLMDYRREAWAMLPIYRRARLLTPRYWKRRVLEALGRVPKPLVTPHSGHYRSLT